MSLLFDSGNCCLLDHKLYISSLYKNVQVNQDSVSFHLIPTLFSINKTKKKENTRKRKRHSVDSLQETVLVKRMFTEFLQYLASDIRKSLLKFNSSETGFVRDLATQLFQTTTFDCIGLNGGNNLEVSLQCKVKGENFLVPPLSRFYCGCVKAQCQKLAGNKYDLVIADPPWWNKYIRRLKAANDKLSYTMMYNEDIAAIPIKDILSSNCLIAVWCTNAPSNIAAVKELIFPKWGVEYLTTWYWLKVTTDLQPLCDFGSGSQKQPYERILLGKVGDVKDVPECKLIVSVPSALHSHKPPLLELLTPYLNVGNPQILELFARYLLPNTTSVGYEPLKWQHLSLYESVT